MSSGQNTSDTSTTVHPPGNYTLDIFTSRSPPAPSHVFKTYWYVAAERQQIFFNKIRTPHDLPYTEDPIFQKYKFTNAYRASDRVSQYLIQNVIYNGNESDR
uniref:nucleotide kinase domain-containing protein n=1 Tax=Salinibacter altiplanensis TaxID=1803181 RepID=UPI0018F8AD0E